MDDDKFVKIPMQAKVRRALSLIGTALIVIVLCYIALSIFQQRNVVIKEPESISVMMNEKDSPEAAAETWMRIYLKQFSQRHIKYTMEIVDYSIDNIVTLENGAEKVFKIDFTIVPRTRYSSYFLSWGDFNKRDRIVKCQWVIVLSTIKRSEEHVEYCCYKKQTSDGYKIEKEMQAVNDNDKKSSEPTTGLIINSKGGGSYTIIQNKCSVSYDNGVTWIEVPAALESLLDSSDEDSSRNTLQDGSYVILPKITAFVFGGTEKTKLSCIYSHDAGASWSTSVINNQIHNARVRFCRFVSNTLGYVVVSFDKNEDGEKQSIFKTTDGGVTWNKTGAGPSSSDLTDCCFLSNGRGFLCYDYVNGKRTNFYYTDDEGRSFAALTLPANKNLDGVFNHPQAPYWEDNKLYLKISQDESSDYLGGKVKALYSSTDIGRTWHFERIVNN